MADGVLAQIRERYAPDGWYATATPVEKPAEPPVTSGTVAATALNLTSLDDVVEELGIDEDADERRQLVCIDRGHVRWVGKDTRIVAARSCAHDNDEADITDDVAHLIDIGHAVRNRQSGALVQLTYDGRRRLADLEREARP